MKYFFLPLLLAVIPTLAFAAVNNSTIKVGDESKGIKTNMHIYGHAYLNDKNTPMSNMVITIEKNSAVIGSGSTNRSGLYDIVITNRDEYLNVCLNSGSGATLKNVRFCEVVKGFQKIGTIMNGVEIRDVEHDFFTSPIGENLNAQYEREVTNSDLEGAYNQFQDVANSNQADQKIEEERRIQEKRREAERAQYRMPNNTEMSGPLKSVQIIGNARKDDDIPFELYSIKLYTHDGAKIYEGRLDNKGEFRIAISPVSSPVFLNPLTLEVTVDKSQEIEGITYPAYEPKYFLVNHEQTIAVITPTKFVPGPLDKVIKIRISPWWFIVPVLGIALILGMGIYALSFNKVYNTRYDY